MVYFAGLDVSVKTTSVCVIDDAGKVLLEQRVTDRAGRYHRRSDLAWCALWPDRDRSRSAVTVAGQWVDGGRPAGDLRGDAALKALLTEQQISKTDRNDARGIAQMMRVSLFKPVHVKTLVAQEQRCC